MSEIWFTAARKFDTSLGEEWVRYYHWAKIPQLEEIISLDAAHRPRELLELTDSDWQHNIHKDYLTAFFRDLDYLLERFAGKRDEVNILAVCLEPSFEVRETLRDGRFTFQGYDLIGGGVSAVNNCGGFDEAFQTGDISEVGLFSTYDFAREVQKRLRERYPSEIHADCELWAIWKMTSQSDRT
jgi:hypothetical protein